MYLTILHQLKNQLKLSKYKSTIERYERTSVSSRLDTITTQYDAVKSHIYSLLRLEHPEVLFTEIHPNIIDLGLMSDQEREHALNVLKNGIFERIPFPIYPSSPRPLGYCSDEAEHPMSKHLDSAYGACSRLLLDKLYDKWESQEIFGSTNFSIETRLSMFYFVSTFLLMTIETTGLLAVQSTQKMNSLIKTKFMKEFNKYLRNRFYVFDRVESLAMYKKPDTVLSVRLNECAGATEPPLDCPAPWESMLSQFAYMMTHRSDITATSAYIHSALPEQTLYVLRRMVTVNEPKSKVLVEEDFTELFEKMDSEKIEDLRVLTKAVAKALQKEYKEDVLEYTKPLRLDDPVLFHRVCTETEGTLAEIIVWLRYQVSTEILGRRPSEAFWYKHRNNEKIYTSLLKIYAQISMVRVDPDFFGEFFKETLIQYRSLKKHGCYTITDGSDHLGF